MYRDSIDLRTIRRYIIAVSPKGKSYQCYSLIGAARLAGFSTIHPIKNSIIEDRPTHNGWKFSEGRLV